MSWSRDNLKFLAGAVAAAVLLCGAAGYLYSKWELNNQKLSELKRTYAENQSVNEKNRERDVANAVVVPKGADEKRGATLNITFRALGHNNVSPVANEETAFEVINQIKSSDYFDASKTRAEGDISAEVSPGTFSFKIVTQLKRPLTL
jgi:hypothetical protein